MTSSYICYQYQFFRQLESSYPFVLKAVSTSAIFFQTIFQLFMLPLMFLRWGRIFVIGWGGIFILLSATSLELSWLPFVEIVFWFLLFCPNRLFISTFGALSRVRQGALPVNKKQQLHWVPQCALLVAAFTWVIYPIHFPVGEKIPLYKALKSATNPLRDAIFYLGCWVPCVFNKEDLSMSDCWITITRHINGKDKLVPLTADDGSRLSYHNFDPLYFGNQVIWRRSLRLLPDEEIIKRHKPDGFNYQLIEKVVNFDYRSNCLEENPVTYTIRIYKSNSLNSDVQADLQAKYAGKCIYSYCLAVPQAIASNRKLDL